MGFQPSPNWSVTTKRTILLIVFALAIALVWFLRDILPIVIVSALVAFILNPIVTFLTRRVLIARDGHGARRGLAALVTFVLTFIFLFILVLTIIPVLGEQVESFGREIPRLVQVVESELRDFLDQEITFNGEPILIDGEPFNPLERIEEATGTSDIGQLLALDQLDLQAAAETFVGSARNLSGPAFSFVGGAFNTLINVIFLIMMTFYLLKDGDHFVQGAISLVPDDYQDDAKRLTKDLGNVWSAYLRGQILLSIIMGFVVYFAALLLGLPNAVTLGLLAGLLEFIPNLGPLIAMIPAAFLALVSESTTIPGLEGFTFMVVVIFVWTMLQNLEAVFLVPRVLGESLDLHPFVVLIAVLGGAAFGGALGVILAAPFVASSRVLLYYIYGKLMDINPFLLDTEERLREPPTVIARVIKNLWDAIRNRLRRLRGRQSAQERVTDAE